MGTETMVLNSINRGVICPVYLFYGTETFLIGQVLSALRRLLVPEGIGEFNFDQLDGALVSPAQVADTAGTLPVFAEKRLVIVKDAPWFSSGKGKGKVETGESDDKSGDKSTEPLLRYLQDPSPYTCLVLLAGEKVNHQRRLVKAIQQTGQALEFPPLRGVDLNQWIVERCRSLGKKIDRGAVDHLAVAGGGNLSILAKEIDKLILYVGKGDKISQADAAQVVSSSTTLSIFDLMDAVGSRKAAQAVRLLREMAKAGEPEVKIASQLTNHLRVMLRVKALSEKGGREMDMAREVGIHPFTAKKALQQGRNFTAGELVADLETMLQLDVDGKTGAGDWRSLLETAVMRMCHREQRY